MQGPWLQASWGVSPAPWPGHLHETAGMEGTGSLGLCSQSHKVEDAEGPKSQHSPVGLRHKSGPCGLSVPRDRGERGVGRQRFSDLRLDPGPGITAICLLIR